MTERFRDRISEALFGNIETTYSALIAAFGEPMLDGGWEKTRAEWDIESPFGRIVIGDWKKHDTPLRELTWWCVNGESRDRKQIWPPRNEWLIADRPAALAWLGQRVRAVLSPRIRRLNRQLLWLTWAAPLRYWLINSSGAITHQRHIKSSRRWLRCARRPR